MRDDIAAKQINLGTRKQEFEQNQLKFTNDVVQLENKINEMTKNASRMVSDPAKSAQQEYRSKIKSKNVRGMC